MDKIKKTLNEARVEEWQILVTEIDGAQGYYIQNKREMTRIQDSSKIEVVVYRDFEENGEKFKGSMKIELYPSMTENEMGQKIKTAFDGALSVRNKWYPLENKKGASRNPKGFECTLDQHDPVDWIDIIAGDVTDIRDNEVNFNSFEIFIAKHNSFFCNSNTLEYKWSEYSGLLEVVSTTRGSSGEEVELFDQFSFSDYNKENIQSKVKHLVQVTKDRANALPLPKLEDIVVVLKGQLLYSFFMWFLTKGSASNIYQGMSDFKTGKKLQKDGDLISLKAVPFMEGSSRNIFIDKNGTLPVEVKIVESGIVNSIVSDLQYGTYLGLSVTGLSQNIEVAPGSMKETDYTQLPHLEAIEFSDFQVDPVTGDFGGEIRLAYYYNGKTRVPVTGGSITGNIYSMLDSIRVSEQLVLHDGYRGPDFICLTGVTIAGV